MIAAVPPQSDQLANLTAEHETDAINGVDYFVRWSVFLPNPLAGTLGKLGICDPFLA